MYAFLIIFIIFFLNVLSFIWYMMKKRYMILKWLWLMSFMMSFLNYKFSIILTMNNFSRILLNIIVLFLIFFLCWDMRFCVCAMSFLTVLNKLLYLFLSIKCRMRWFFHKFVFKNFIQDVKSIKFCSNIISDINYMIEWFWSICYSTILQNLLEMKLMKFFLTWNLFLIIQSHFIYLLLMWVCERMCELYEIKIIKII